MTGVRSFTGRESVGWFLGFVLCLTVFLAGASGAPAADAPEGVHLQAQRSRRVGNDTMHATLVAEAQGHDPAEVAATVNRIMGWALEQARSAAGVKVESGGYQTRPVWDKQKIRRWHARQELLLEASDPDLLSRLLGELQTRMQLSQVRFTISPAKRRRVEDELISEALDAFKARAKLVVANLAAPGYRIAELHVDTGGGPTPVRMQERLLASADVAVAPAFEAGTSRVTVQVRGRILLEE